MQQQKAQLEGCITADEISSSALLALLYFDIFNHPLSLEDIFQNSRISPEGKNKLPGVLEQLVADGMIYRFGAYYSISNEEKFVKRRLEGQKLAQKYLERARLVSRIISWFPFVRGVLISGSLSKGYMDKGSDIDYFIVTETGRLWLCRSLLAIQRKLMVGPLRKYFCINYFVDLSSLSIPDQNIFTATEISYVYPTYSLPVFHLMQESNVWINNYYPNKEKTYTNVNSKLYAFSIKTLLEKIFSGRLGEWADTVLFRFMLKRWKKRYENFDETQFDLNIRTKKNVSKQHEKGYQTIVLEKYSRQISDFENRHQVKIQHG